MLALGSPGSFTDAIDGFVAGDKLDHKGLSYMTGATATLAGDTLTVTGAGITDFFTLEGVPAGQHFAAMDDGTPAHGTLVEAVNCFSTGTRICSLRGGRMADVAVEALKLGDRAVTVSGGAWPILWIGQRSLGSVFLGRHPDAGPVRVLAGAFGDQLPMRDLRLSPGHPVLIGADDEGEGGVLVPIQQLINGNSIARETVHSVTYWHIELESHDILLAEGLWRVS